MTVVFRSLLPFGIPASVPVGEVIDTTFDLGSKLLYRAATGLERALADTEAEQLMSLKAELIIEVWDAFKISVDNLPFLAWAHGVDIWEDGWSEETQRNWVDRQIEFKSIRGTEGAFRMALDFAGRDFVPGGYELLQMVSPPGGFFASPNLTVEEHNEWIRQMPQIRIYLGNDPGTALNDEWFIGDGFIGMHGVGVDDGATLYGRKAILRRYGQADVPLNVWSRSRTTETYETVDWEEIREPGVSEYGFFINDFIGDDKFIGWDEIEAKLYNVRLDRTYDAMSTQFHLSTVVPTLEPIDVTYERNSDIGDAGLDFFVGDGAIDVNFIGHEYASVMLADYIYLLDPNVATPMNKGVSFIGVDRIGIHPYTVELLIDLHTTEPLPVWFIGDTAIGEGFIAKEDTSHQERAIRAVRAAKSLRDRVLVAFNPLRQLTASDYADEDTLMEAWKDNTL